MLVLIGASASGKTEIAKYLIKHYDMKKVITYTTRKMRPNETNHIDYHFITMDDFIDKKNNKFFLETSLYNQNYYGTAFKDVTDDSVLIVDINGANFLSKQNLSNTYFMFLKASKEIREERMKQRGDSYIKITERLKNDDEDFRIDKLNHIDYIIDTNHLSIEELANNIYDLYYKKIKR